MTEEKLEVVKDLKYKAGMGIAYCGAENVVECNVTFTLEELKILEEVLNGAVYMMGGWS